MSSPTCGTPNNCICGLCNLVATQPTAHGWTLDTARAEIARLTERVRELEESLNLGRQQVSPVAKLRGRIADLEHKVDCKGKDCLGICRECLRVNGLKNIEAYAQAERRIADLERVLEAADEFLAKGDAADPMSLVPADALRAALANAKCKKCGGRGEVMGSVHLEPRPVVPCECRTALAASGTAGERGGEGK